MELTTSERRFLIDLVINAHVGAKQIQRQFFCVPKMVANAKLQEAVAASTLAKLGHWFTPEEAVMQALTDPESEWTGFQALLDGARQFDTDRDAINTAFVHAMEARGFVVSSRQEGSPELHFKLPSAK